MVDAGKQSMRKTEENGCPNMWFEIRYVCFYLLYTTYRQLFLFSFVQYQCYQISEKQIDVDTVDLKTLKVRDLRKILSDWDETCDGCIEKTDFIKRIQELKPKYSRSSKSELWKVFGDLDKLQWVWLRFGIYFILQNDWLYLTYMCLWLNTYMRKYHFVKISFNRIFEVRLTHLCFSKYKIISL